MPGASLAPLYLMANAVTAKTERLSFADTAWLRMDSPTNPMIITALATYDEPLPLDEVESFIQTKLLPVTRFRQRLALHPARWEIDADLDWTGQLHHVALPEPGDDRELERLVSDVMSRPLDPRRPLWEIHLVDGYGKGSALVVRVHHALADGIALVRLLGVLTGDGSPSVRPIAHEDRNALVRGGRAVVAAGRLVALPGDPKTSLKGRLGTIKRAAFTRAIPLVDLKAIAHARGAKLNDVFATIVAGGLRRRLAARGEIREGLEVRAVVPVNLRPDAGPFTLGNRFGLVFLALPLWIDSPEDRLREIVRRTHALKDSEEAVVTFAILEAMAVAGETIDNLIVDIFQTKATLVMTSVPGPLHPVTFAGGRVRSFVFWAPQAGRLGLGVSILSYAGEVRIGVASDARALPEPGEIARGIEAELAALAKP